MSVFWQTEATLALAGNAHVTPPAANAGCACGHVCPRRQPQKQQQPLAAPQIPNKMKTESHSTVFRHPTPIAPKLQAESAVRRVLSLSDLPRRPSGRGRGRGRGAGAARGDRRVVRVRTKRQKNLIPVKMVPNSPPPLPRLLPKPPPTPTSDMSFYYVLSESNGQFFFHDGGWRIPITPLQDDGHEQRELDKVADDIRTDEDEDDDTKEIIEMKVEVTETSVAEPSGRTERADQPERERRPEQPDIANFLPAESMSLSPSRLLRDAEGWLEGSVQDFSLSSFLGHLEGRPHPEMPVDSQLHSLMAQSSVDYMAKFADLAAEVTEEPGADDLP